MQLRADNPICTAHIGNNLPPFGCKQIVNIPGIRNTRVICLPSMFVIQRRGF